MHQAFWKNKKKLRVWVIGTNTDENYLILLGLFWKRSWKYSRTKGQIYLPLMTGLSVKCVIYKIFLSFIRFWWNFVKLLYTYMKNTTTLNFIKIWRKKTFIHNTFNLSVNGRWIWSHTIRPAPGLPNDTSFNFFCITLSL